MYMHDSSAACDSFTKLTVESKPILECHKPVQVMMCGVDMDSGLQWYKEQQT